MRMQIDVSWIDPLDELLGWAYSGIHGATDLLRDIFFMTLGGLHLGQLQSFTDADRRVQQGLQLLVLATYVTMVVAGGIVVMTHETIQTRYSLREIAPRLFVGFGLVWFSKDLIGLFRYQTNQLVYALIADGGRLNHWALEDGYGDLLTAAVKILMMRQTADFAISSVLTVVGALMVMVVLVVSAVLREIAFLGVVMVAPLALACHGLPFTEAIAKWWWRALIACCATPVGQAAAVWIWSLIAFRDNGNAVGETEHAPDFGADIMFVIVLGWVMWKVHAATFSWARGRQVSFPGARLAKGLAMGAAVGTGHRLVRRWAPAAREKLSARKSASTASSTPFRLSTGWGNGDGSTRAIRVRRPEINKDVWTKTTAKPKTPQPARVVDGPVKGRGSRRALPPVLPKLQAARPTATPQHGAGFRRTPVETTGAGPGTSAPRRIVGPLPRPDAKKFTRARQRLHASQRRNYPQPKDGDKS